MEASWLTHHSQVKLIPVTILLPISIQVNQRQYIYITMNSHIPGKNKKGERSHFQLPQITNKAPKYAKTTFWQILSLHRSFHFAIPVMQQDSSHLILKLNKLAEYVFCFSTNKNRSDQNWHQVDQHSEKKANNSSFFGIMSCPVLDNLLWQFNSWKLNKSLIM